MSEESENKPVRVPKWLWAGSAFWLISVFLFAWFVFWPNITGGLKPNEFGDLLAGAFSPLAFAWFVYAVFMQRQELELQRQELSETRAVLKEQEQAQSASAIQSARLAELNEKLLNLSSEEKKYNLFFNSINYMREFMLNVGSIIITTTEGNSFSIIFADRNPNNHNLELRSFERIFDQIKNNDNQKIEIDGSRSRNVNEFFYSLEKIRNTINEDEYLMAVFDSLYLERIHNVMRKWIS